MIYTRNVTKDFNNAPTHSTVVVGRRKCLYSRAVASARKKFLPGRYRWYFAASPNPFSRNGTRLVARIQRDDLCDSSYLNPIHSWTVSVWRIFSQRKFDTRSSIDFQEMEVDIWQLTIEKWHLTFDSSILYLTRNYVSRCVGRYFCTPSLLNKNGIKLSEHRTLCTE